MKAFKVFVFGLLYGWLLKIAFDRIYRNNEVEDIRHENAALKDYVRTLEARLQPKSLETKSLKQAASVPGRTRSQAQTGSQKDDLKSIRGVGPVIERKLNKAGIHTFEALAQLSIEDLEGILGSTRRLVKEGDLIQQAKKLARQRA